MGSETVITNVNGGTKKPAPVRREVSHGMEKSIIQKNRGGVNGEIN